MQKTSGLLFFLAGTIVLLGIVLAEIFYPGYNVSKDFISNLGATRPPHSITIEPSGSIFDISMMVAGLLVLAGAVLLPIKGSLKYAMIIMGVGTAGVGLFPASHPTPHLISAGASFLLGGVSAMLSSKTISGLFKYVVVLLGATAIFFLFTGVATSSIFVPTLGAGGAERFVAYPIIIWLISYGGYLMGKSKN